MKTEMTTAEFRETIAQNPGTKAELIKRIEEEYIRVWAERDARNEASMVLDNCSEEAIDIVKEMNQSMLRPAIKQAVLELLGVNLVDGPEYSKQ